MGMTAAMPQCTGQTEMDDETWCMTVDGEGIVNGTVRFRRSGWQG